MEIREWAMRVFTADCLEEKLIAPPDGLAGLTDEQPGLAVAWQRPARPSHLSVAGRNKRKKFPRSLERQEARIRALHAFANHELMALELMAWALLAFPQAERSFRVGLANILREEQHHFSLYAERLQKMGTTFGDLPLNDHFWRIAEDIHHPLDWVCAMHLTFEQANLDHAPYFARLFEEVDDAESAQLMHTIFEDEIRHVRFGSRWLKHYQPEDKSMFEVFSEHCSPKNPPDRARGFEFQRQARLDAGLDPEFVEAMLAAE